MHDGASQIAAAKARGPTSPVRRSAWYRVPHPGAQHIAPSFVHGVSVGHGGTAARPPAHVRSGGWK